MQQSKKEAGAQALAAIGVLVVLAITAPLLGIVMIFVVPLAAAARALVRSPAGGGVFRDV